MIVEVEVATLFRYADLMEQVVQLSPHIRRDLFAETEVDAEPVTEGTFNVRTEIEERLDGQDAVDRFQATDRKTR